MDELTTKQLGEQDWLAEVAFLSAYGDFHLPAGSSHADQRDFLMELYYSEVHPWLAVYLLHSSHDLAIVGGPAGSRLTIEIK